MDSRKNIFEMYVENDCRLGFFVTRDSWGNGKYARVVAIDGVIDGTQIEGESPYYNIKYPVGHDKAGESIQRNARLEADWLDGGFTITTGAGGFTWTRVYPNDNG